MKSQILDYYMFKLLMLFTIVQSHPLELHTEPLPFLGMDEDDYHNTEKVVREITAKYNMQAGMQQPPQEPLPHQQNSIILGDIVLTLEQSCLLLEELGGSSNSSIIELCTQHSRQKRKAIDFTQYGTYRWQGTVNVVIDLPAGSLGEAAVENAMRFWQENTCITLQRRGINYRQKHIRIINGGGCWSFVGRTRFSEQQLSLSPGCTQLPGTAIHEMGHAFGFFHEQSRPDRNSYVQIIRRNIVEGFESNFDIALGTNTYNTPYDYASVMHYGGDDALCRSCSGYTIRAKQAYSQQSMGNSVSATFLDLLAMNNAYQCESRGACARNTLRCANGGFPDFRSGCTVCQCPEGLGGNLCERTATNSRGCIPSTSELTATTTEQCINSPSYPRLNLGSTCSWKIKSSGNSPVKVRFAGSFFAAATSSTGRLSNCQNYVEIKNSTDLQLRGMRFCGRSAPVFEDTYLDTYNSEVLVHYSSELQLIDGSRFGALFRLCFRTEIAGICATFPCMNSGRCVSDDEVSFTCDCTDTGFTGEICETELDECLSSPCDNGGSCADGINYYTCNCDDTDYFGTNCQTPRICSTSPCLQNGTCHSTDDVIFTCDCTDTGYEGETCDTEVDECIPSPCYNGATCEDGINSFSCDCVTGFSGDLCEIGTCDVFPCDQGNCTDGGERGYTCSCEVGYEGHNCDSLINPCDDIPCSNGGQCSSDGDGINFTCDCSGTGYIGETCEIAGICVSSFPCQNGGVCESDDGIEFSCDCDNTGFTGDTCQTAATACASNPCQNGGTCLNRADGGYNCLCRRNWRGRNCQRRR